MSTVYFTHSLPPADGGEPRRLEVCQGDLTQEAVDAIVNAANEHLAHGGGIAAAIARAGGPAVEQESAAWVRAHGPVTHDAPAYTSGGRLPARFVIHAVGPRMGEGDEDRKLAAAITGSLRRAGELGLASVAFPAISTGIFGFPRERAARLFFQAIPAFFQEDLQSSVRLVKIVLWERETLDIFLQAAQTAFHP